MITQNAKVHEDTDLEMKNISGDGSRFAAVTDARTGRETSGSESQRHDKPPSGPSKSTGPRTPRGKGRSKNNAITHGIFAKAVVLRGESQDEFNALLSGLHKDFQPVGTFENLCVEKLAVDHWRLRRLLLEEGREIHSSSELVEWDEKERQRQEAASLPQPSCNGGLMRWIENSVVLQACVNLLNELKEDIKVRGFVPEEDNVILTKLYGRDEEQNWQHALLSSYLQWSRVAAVSEEERKQNGLPSSEEAQEGFLSELRGELRRLGRYAKKQATILARQLKLQSLGQRVPYASQPDRLLRCETSLDRSIERKLNRLERLQRMRLGQPVLPPIHLDVTTSG